MKTILIIFLSATLVLAGNAQTSTADTLYDATRPDIRPVFKGCETLDNMEERKACSDREMLQYIFVHFKMPDVEDVHPCCTVAATFIIEKDGSVQDAVIIKELHPLMDAELLRVIASMPRWTPAMTKGRPVRFKMILPLRIRLE